jgi:hypothetical protein
MGLKSFVHGPQQCFHPLDHICAQVNPYDSTPMSAESLKITQGLGVLK